MRALGVLAALALLAACTGEAPEPEPAATDVPEELAGPGQPVAGQAGIGTPLEARVAVLGLLNKRNNISRELEMKPGEARRVGDVVVREHWSASGFANTDLDLQLKQHGVRRVVLVGLLANTCIEATARFAAELGYHVTLVRDATAAFTPLAMQCAHELNGPTFAQAIVSTEELLAGWRGDAA